MEILPYIFIAIVGLVSWIFPGISVGGGTMIMIPAFIGTRIGSKIVLRRGETFVSVVMVITLFVSSVVLLINAL